jgi:cytochrome P450 family 142 subfamily A polypeptide 1
MPETVPPPPCEIDALDPRFYDDPWEAYRWLRQHSPVHWDAKNELWLISRHADVCTISRDQARYSAAEGVRPRVAAPMSIISMDDPEHTRQRRLINRGFTPARVRELTDHIRELSNEIIDEVAGRGTLDFVAEFAIHVPLIVIAELMGLDPDQRARLYKWSDAMMAGDSAIDADDPALIGAAEAFGEYATMCLSLIEERRADPDAKDDLISVLTQAFDDGALAREDRPHRRRADHVPRAHRGGRQRDHTQRAHRWPPRAVPVPRAEAARDRGPIPLGDRGR